MQNASEVDARRVSVVVAAAAAAICYCVDDGDGDAGEMRSERDAEQKCIENLCCILRLITNFEFYPESTTTIDEDEEEDDGIVSVGTFGTSGEY